MTQSNLSNFVSISSDLRERKIVKSGKNIPDSRKFNKPSRVNTRELLTIQNEDSQEEE